MVTWSTELKPGINHPHQTQKTLKTEAAIFFHPETAYDYIQLDQIDKEQKKGNSGVMVL
jgi:hypothetical protein